MKILSLSFLALFLALPAFAADLPVQPLPPIAPGPSPAPYCTFCDGFYEGFLAAQPGPLSLEFHSRDVSGQFEVTGRWNAYTWYGQGFCQQVAQNQAMVSFQFPNTPVQRGMLTVYENGSAELDGQVDGGDSFRVMRQGQ